MSVLLLWSILLGTAIIIVLAVVLLARSSLSLHSAGKEVRDDLRAGREEARGSAKELREELSNVLKSSGETLSKTFENVGQEQQTQFEGMTKQLKEFTDSNQHALESVRNTFDSRSKELQESNDKKLDEMRKGISEGLNSVANELSKILGTTGTTQQKQLEAMTKQLKDLTDSNQQSLDRIRSAFDSRIKELQESNERKLEEMRKTVDERLHDTLEKRLGESFKLVGDRLEAVHKDLGEMQHLATGVGDLKRVLTNVKIRGTWAEVQLGAILEQILTPDQYGKNVQLKSNRERVEYAVKLPGPKEDPTACLWLPIDSKFPQEDYLRIQAAAEKADSNGVKTAGDELARAIRSAAKDIHDKYIDPPNTTDFAIMFLATEGIYAEVLRQPALAEDLQQRYRVVVAGPTTLAAILNSLRMGFQTLAIEKRAAEVWKVLGAIKTEFGKFGEVLDKVKRQLDTASHTIEETGVRQRVMERKLRSVEQLPAAEASTILALSTTVDEADTDEPQEEK